MGITERIDNITRIPDRYLNTVLPAPQSVKIELTGRCNFRCAFCARSKRYRKQQDMDFDFFRKVVRDMRDSGVQELGLFYLGESFLYKQLEQAVWYAKYECGFPYVFLTTNGSLATPDRVEKCMRNGLDSLKFSFNYIDKQQFREIAQVKPKLYDQMMENIAAAYEARNKVEYETGHHCGLYASFIQYDGAQGLRMLQEVGQITPFTDEVYALPLYNQASLVTQEEIERGWQPTAGNRGRLDALRDPLPCWACFTEGHITWDGRLSACCFDHTTDFTMADLNEVSFMEGWNSEKFQVLRSAHLKKDVTGTVCESCVAYKECKTQVAQQ